MFKQIGPTEIILIIAVIVLLFGAKKLPDLARGSGRALRIFKSETKGLIDDDDDESKKKDDDEATPEIESAESDRATYDIDEKTGSVVPRDQSK
ncbi:Sec-independent protein translocase subunit TatA [Solicola gregarius]|uniref:Sec-independent protein translocase protein TatA n=1 Tax=Solicola gregarius TaxID=2908642 RepID=A0AA46TGT2_9ACTN|nr:Sec-independent protein translocase subunit TatA [Solicola gregarius]UYM05056.1 Sec-independent protein translocase subunit TatA [Solicola gregarius]